jgi:predicted GH43/DUF377 family glycosyl hydrolase
MAMTWRKLGRIFCPSGESDWMASHATLPIPYRLDEERLRIYFGTRDRKGRSHTAYVDVLQESPQTIVEVAKEPLLAPGALGEFDDCGAMPSWICEVGDDLWLYYIGWNVRSTIPYHNSIGLAISRDGGQSFERFAAGPLLDRTYKEPHFCAAPCVIIEDGLWRMWYLSCTEWVMCKGRAEPRYHIKYCESSNGIDWKREGVVAIDYKSPQEAGLVRACVRKHGDGYRMWFSYRQLEDYRTNPRKSYRIGYAESGDGVSWVRKDEEAGIDVSESGWDSEMIEYPYVFRQNDNYLLLYNGNAFGRSGFGLAQLED